MANGRTRNGSSVARLSLLLTVALAAPAWSQVQSGRIVGTVRDAQQATVPKATVTVTSSATGQSLNVTDERPRRLRGHAGQPRSLPGDGGAGGASRPPSSTRWRSPSGSPCAWTWS